MSLLLPKREAVRDEKWRRELASRPCRACGAPLSQAAHLGHSSMGKKECDRFCVSLCPTCHVDFDTFKAGKERWWMQYVAIPEARRAYDAWRDGVNVAHDASGNSR